MAHLDSVDVALGLRRQLHAIRGLIYLFKAHHGAVLSGEGRGLLHEIDLGVESVLPMVEELLPAPRAAKAGARPGDGG